MLGTHFVEATVSDLAHFFAYVRAFEIAVLSDDWTILEPFFAPDAEHRVLGPAPFACDDLQRIRESSA